MLRMVRHTFYVHVCFSSRVVAGGTFFDVVVGVDFDVVVLVAVIFVVLVIVLVLVVLVIVDVDLVEVEVINVDSVVVAVVVDVNTVVAEEVVCIAIVVDVDTVVAEEVVCVDIVKLVDDVEVVIDDKTEEDAVDNATKVDAMVAFEVGCALVGLGVSFTLLVAFVLTVVFSSAPHPQFSLRNSLNLGLGHGISKLS